MNSEAITYSLKISDKNSDRYFEDISAFTDEILLSLEEQLSSVVTDYMNFLSQFGLEELRTREEYLFELLSFGMFWKIYGKAACGIRSAPFLTLSKMADIRKRKPGVKPFIDIARGILFTLFLFPKNTAYNNAPDLKDVDRLCLFLESTGEFREQSFRFIRWRAFLDTVPDSYWEKGRDSVFNAVDSFIEKSRTSIGKYTANVESFLETSGKKYHWREDRFQCGRTREEYHLNMVGAEIMNRAFRKGYLGTEKRVLLLPGCMRRNIKDCKGLKVREGLQCMDCDKGCGINALRKKGLKENFDVFIIPHSSDLSLWAPKPGMPKRGVVAVACVPSLVEGGWELKRYDVCAQCVLLDFSGCEKHWHKNGIPTRLNIKELNRILN